MQNIPSPPLDCIYRRGLSRNLFVRDLERGIFISLFTWILLKVKVPDSLIAVGAVGIRVLLYLGHSC